MTKLERPSSFTEVIGLWPTQVELASDTGAAVYAVRQWKARDRIPAEWWDALLAAANKRRFRQVTADLLLSLTAKRKRAA